MMPSIAPPDDSIESSADRVLRTNENEVIHKTSSPRNLLPKVSSAIVSNLKTSNRTKPSYLRRSHSISAISTSFELPPWMDNKYAYPGANEETFFRPGTAGSIRPGTAGSIRPGTAGSIRPGSPESYALNRNIEPFQTDGVLRRTRASPMHPKTKKFIVNRVAGGGGQSHLSGTEVRNQSDDQEKSKPCPKRKSKLETAMLLRNERKLKEKLKRGLGLKGVQGLKCDTYQIQTVDVLGQALVVATDIQNALLRKKWPVLRDAFRYYGGIMSPKSLRLVLLREVGVPIKQAARIEHTCKTELMEEGDQFILYEDFKKMYKYLKSNIENQKHFDKRMSGELQNPVAATNETESDDSDAEQDQAPRLSRKSIQEVIKNSNLTYRQAKLKVGQMMKERRLKNMREKLAGRAHTRGEIHRDDANRMLKNIGSSLYFLNMLDKRCAQGMKRMRKNETPKKESARFRISTKMTKDRERIASRRLKAKLGSPVSGAHSNTKVIFSQSSSRLLLDNNESIRLASACDLSAETLARSSEFEEASLLRNIAEVRSLAALMIQVQVRRWLSHQYFQYLKANEHSRRRIVKLSQRCFRLWRQDTTSILAFYQRTRRPFYLIRKYAAGITHKKRIFRICYWPFYVWRRHWEAMSIARSKAVVLLRLWKTLLLLRCFRAIQCTWTRMLDQTKLAEQHQRSKIYALHASAFEHWKQEVKFKSFMKAKWKATGGQGVILLSNSMLQYRALRCWWYYALVRKQTRIRARNKFCCIGLNEDDINDEASSTVSSNVQALRSDGSAASRPVEANGFLSPTMAVTLRGLRSGGSVNPKSVDFDRACAPLHLEYADKLPLLRRQIYFQFRTLIPRLFNRWMYYVELSQQSRYSRHALAMRWKKKVYHAIRRHWLFAKVSQRGIASGGNGKLDSLRRTQSVPMLVHQPYRRVEEPKAPPDRLQRKNSKRITGVSSKQLLRRESRKQVVQLRAATHGVQASEYQLELERRPSLAPKDFEMASMEYEALRKQYEEGATQAVQERRLKRIAIEEAKKKRREQAERARAEAWKRDMEMAEKMTKEAHQASLLLKQKRLEEKKTQRKHVKGIRNKIQQQLNTDLQMSMVLQTRKLDMGNIKSYAQENGKRLHLMRAEMLHDVLCKIITEVEENNMSRLKIACFKRLKVAVMQRKATKEANKDRLRHWLHICANVRKLYRSTPNYRKVRMKISAFSRWLKFVDTRYRYQTPGLHDNVLRRFQLLFRYDWYILELQVQMESKALELSESKRRHHHHHHHRHHHHRHHRRHHHRLHSRHRHSKDTRGRASTSKIKDNPLKWTSNTEEENEKHHHHHKHKHKHHHKHKHGHHHHRHHHHHKKKHHSSKKLVDVSQQMEEQLHSFNLGSFLFRWMEFTQSRAIRRKLVATFRRRHDLRTKHKVLWSLHQTLRPEYTFATRTSFDDQPPFGVIRASFDLDLIHTHFLVPERKLMTSFMRRTCAFTKRKLKERAQNTMTLKKLQKMQRESVNARLELETRLLVSAFHDRASYHFRDVKLPVFQANQETPPVSPLPRRKRRGSAPGIQEKKMVPRESAVSYSDGENGDSSDSEGGNTRTTGNIFDDKKDGLLPTAHQEIKELVVHICDGFVHSLRTQYRNMRTGVDVAVAEVMGGLRGTRHVFRLNCTEGEKLIGVELCHRRFVYRIRFHTSFGRASSWFGEARSQGKRFLLGSKEKESLNGKVTTSIPDITTGQRNKVVVNKFVDEYIVGFHGRLVMSNVQQLGIYERHVIEKGVFVSCWKNKVLTMNAEDEVEMETNESRQFAYVLRMRSADIHRALDRAQSLGRRMYCSRDSESVALTSLVAVEGVSRWLFNTLSVGLLNTPSSEDMGGEQLVEKGHVLIKCGREQVEEGRGFLKSIPGYNSNGNHEISLTLYGKHKYNNLMTAIDEAEGYVKAGEAKVEEGQQFVERGMSIRPQIPDRTDVRAYFEHLVKLAQMKDTIGKVANDCSDDEGKP